jgi:hypothetical protein
MRSTSERSKVVRLSESGLSDRAVARATGIPRATVGHWYIARSGSSARLSLTLDLRHPEIANEAAGALALVFPDARVASFNRPLRGTREVVLSSPSLPYAYPHCGQGKKHERRISLMPWQLAVTRAHPKSLLRGLIHSDGCRTVNRFSTTLPSGRIRQYAYPRYFFSNLSCDIRGIFCDHCDLLGIRWTLSNPRNVSIADRGSVRVLDGFVGPKS